MVSDTESKPVAETEDVTSWKESPFLALKGFIMGSADIIPGVSGGTMALILGIYSRLIHAISSFDLRFIKQFFTFKWTKAFKNVHWKFLAVLIAGIACAILFFTKVVPLQVYMFTHPKLIFGLFFGLIVGSIYILIKELEAINWQVVIYILAGVAIGFWVVTRIPTNTPTSGWFLFLSGSLAISAMVLPGISGSYILLILRKYDYILTQIGKLGTPETMNGLWILLPFVIGMIVGLALFTRFLSWLLDNYYTRTLAVLIGFLIGSLYLIWPYQVRDYTQFVKETEVVAYSAPEAEVLRANSPNKNLPEYQRLGDIVNPAAADSLKKIEIETVEQKFTSADPYIPYLDTDDGKTENFWRGIFGMIVGLCLVYGLDYLRHKE